jgi:peptide/nickel transport system substrate-binding protein
MDNHERQLFLAAKAAPATSVKQLNRRQVLIHGAAIAASLPAVTTLLAACGGDDTEPTATSGTGEATPTAAMEEATASVATDDPTATTNASEATPTEVMEGSSTAPAAEVTEIYGLPIEPAQNEGGLIVWGTYATTSPYYLLTYGDNMKSEALVEPHPETGEYYPLLATAWELADDGMSASVSLRQGVTFHDGEALTPADVVFSIALKNAAPGWGTDPVASATVTELDDETVEFAFTNVGAGFADSLSYYLMFAAHALTDLDLATADESIISAHPASLGTDLDGLVGTGPFRLVEVVDDDHETYERYDSYWGGKPHLDQIILRVFGGADLYVPALQIGEIDIAGSGYDSLNPAQIGDVDPGVARIAEFPGANTYRFVPNLWPERDSPFLDVRVRQALMYGSDRQAIVEAVLFGYGSVPIIPTVVPTWAYDSAGITNLYQYDPDQAAALLDEAGWVMGSDGVREKDGRTLSFVGWYTAGETTIETAAIVLQEQWRQLGIEMTPQTEDGQALYDRFTESHDFDLIFWGSGATIDQRIFFSCSADGWATQRYGYCNEELDALMDQAAATLDVEEQVRLNTEILNALMAEVPMGPLFVPEGLNGIASRLHNVYPNVQLYTFNCETWWAEE